MQPLFNDISSVIFDFDGTLADTCPDIVTAKQAAIRAIGLPPADPDMLCSMNGMRIRDSFIMTSDVTSDALLGEAIDIYHETFTDLALASLRLYDGVRETLGALRRRGMKIAVISLRRHADLRRVMERAGIFDMADLYAGDDFIAAKPSPEVIDYICDRFDTDPGRVLLVGDTNLDIEMGREGGCRTAAFTRGAQTRRMLATSGPDAMFDSLPELEALIA